MALFDIVIASAFTILEGDESWESVLRFINKILAFEEMVGSMVVKSIPLWPGLCRKPFTAT